MSGRPAPVRGRQVFAALGTSRRRAAAGAVRVHFVPSDVVGDRSVRVAYSVSRKLGGAVVRNRCRRRLRAIAATTAATLPAGAYLIVASPAVGSTPFEELTTQVIVAMHKASEEKP